MRAAPLCCATAEPRGLPERRRSLVRSRRKAPSRTSAREAAQADGRAEDPHARARERWRAPTSRRSRPATSRGWSTCWAPGGIENIAPLGRPLSVPDEMRRVLHRDCSPRCRTCASRCSTWSPRATRRPCAGTRAGTFCGGPFQGIEPTGARVELEGIDMLTIEDGKIRAQRRLLRQRRSSRARSACCRHRTARPSGAWRPRSTRARACCARSSSRTSSQVADGVWLVRGGFPLKIMNVYLIEDERRVTVFDAGIRGDGARHRARSPPASAASSASCSATAIPTTAAPRRAWARPSSATPTTSRTREGDGGAHYFDFSKLDWYARPVMPRLLGVWDGGPVKVEGTVSEGDDIAGFKVVDLPGHAPGLIGLWRESDRLALSSDTFYTLEPADRAEGRAARPAPAFNQDTEQGAREHPQAGRDGAGRRVARPRGSAHRRRARPAGARRLTRPRRTGLRAAVPGVGVEPTRP